LPDRTPPSRGAGAGESRRLARYYSANVLFAAGLFSHAFLYNFYLVELGHGESVMGLAAASLTAGGLAALVPAGRVVDRVGARRAYVVACVVGFAGLVLGALARSTMAIVLAAFVAGAGTATWRVSMGPLLMRVAGVSSRSRAFSWNVALLLATGSLWTALSGLLPGWLERNVGLTGLEAVRVVLIAGALATLAGVLSVVGSVGGPESGAVRGRGPAVPGAILARLREAFSVPRPVAAFVVAAALWMTAGGLVIPFFNVFFLREHGMAVGRIGVLFGLAQGATALAVFAGGVLAGRAGPGRMLLAWSLPFAPLLWALALTTAVPFAIGLFVLQGFVPAATNPLIDQLLLERTPAERHGAVSTWRNAATELSGLWGAAAGGALLEATSFGALFALAGGIAVVGILGLARAIGRLQPARPGSVAPAYS